MEPYMDRVIAAQVYNRICELGSLSAAARALGISRPMVSRYLEQMEKWAGTRLVNRSTRKLTLTAAGEKVLQKTRILALISQDIEGQSPRDLPSGTLRVACAHFTAMHMIAPAADLVLTSPSAPTTDDAEQEAVAALVALGYKPQEASRMVSKIAKPDANSETLIREALRAAL
jgi:molybdate transport repressor ModE-like protein